MTETVLLSCKRVILHLVVLESRILLNMDSLSSSEVHTLTGEDTGSRTPWKVGSSGCQSSCTHRLAVPSLSCPPSPWEELSSTLPAVCPSKAYCRSPKVAGILGRERVVHTPRDEWEPDGFFELFIWLPTRPKSPCGQERRLLTFHPLQPPLWWDCRENLISVCKDVSS